MLVDKVRERFEYRDGGLYWKWNRTNPHLEGRRAGKTRSDGYRYTKIDGVEYQEHRLVMLLHGVEVGKGEVVHHIDFNKQNNARNNLVVWEKSFHRNWHAAQDRNPLCIRFKRGGIYHPQYVAQMSSPNGYVPKEKRALTDEERAEKKRKQAEYSKAYYEANKEKILAKAKAYYAENRDERLEYQREYERRQHGNT